MPDKRWKITLDVAASPPGRVVVYASGSHRLQAVTEARRQVIADRGWRYTGRAVGLLTLVSAEEVPPADL